jgi:fatty-acyl-CoA synthase
LTCIVHRMTLVLPAPQFDALASLEAIQAERCTILYGVPTMFIAELEHPRFREFDLTSLRTGIMAGAPCPIEIMTRVVGEMHCPEMTIGYGQTESSPLITISSCSDDLETRVSTVGCAIPGTEVKIIAPGSGATVEAGERGELCTRGYMGNPRPRRELLMPKPGCTPAISPPCAPTGTFILPDASKK